MSAITSTFRAADAAALVCIARCSALAAAAALGVSGYSMLTITWTLAAWSEMLTAEVSTRTNDATQARKADVSNVSIKPSISASKTTTVRSSGGGGYAVGGAEDVERNGKTESGAAFGGALGACGSWGCGAGDETRVGGEARGNEDMGSLKGGGGSHCEHGGGG